MKPKHPIRETFHHGLVPASALAIAMCTMITLSANGEANPSPLPAFAHQTPAARGAAVHSDRGACYDNNGSGDTGVGVASENHSDDWRLDSEGAVDFSVKTSCTIGTVTTTGVYYNGSGPAYSVNVVFWTNRNGKPGKIVNEQTDLEYTDLTGIGALQARIDPVTLPKGKYFVSFVANITLLSDGQWGWELTSNQAGGPDQWENGGGEYGVCPTWSDVLTCTGSGNDFMVSLSS